MNKTSIDQYLPLNSLFKPSNKKIAASHHAPTQYLHKTPAPLKSSYTPPNPSSFQVKDAPLCNTCHHKKHTHLGQQSMKLQELQGVERQLSFKNSSMIAEKPAQRFGEGTRPLNYINEPSQRQKYVSKTVIMNPNRNSQVQRFSPSSVVRSPQNTDKPINNLDIPITEQEHLEESSIKNVEIVKGQSQVHMSEERRSKGSGVNILINSQQPPQQNKSNEPSLLNTPTSEPRPDQHLQPTKRNFTMHRTESNYFTDTIAKEEPPQQIERLSVRQEKKDISSYRESRDFDVKQTNSKMIRGGSNFERIAPISSIASKSEIGVNTSRENILNQIPSAIQTQGQRVYDSDQDDRQAFFNSTKRDSNRYIESIRNQLTESYRGLESAQSEIDILVQKNLELECQKIKNHLYRAIDLELNYFKDNERRKLSNTKFNYMSDLYELKCNIDLRLQELEEYQMAFSNEYKWKTVVGDLLTPDYEATIHFLVNKSAEIEEQSLLQTNNFLADYNNKMFTDVLEPLKKEIKQAIQNLFINFTTLRERKLSYQAFMQKYYGDQTTRQR